MLCSDAVKKGTGALLESVFLKKSAPVLENRVARVYPYQVKIPKSIDELLQGDFEPAQIINVEKPFIGEYGPMWFGNSTDGIALRSGYKNGDSRFINDVTLGDKDIHAIMGGATGQGKSVALNVIIYGICYEYAPWEVRLTLSDAKIVEFKSIAMNTPMTHIDTIAATGDVDYLLSVLDDKIEEMNKRQGVFTKAAVAYGKKCANIMDFRKITGLCLPRNLLVFDEFQTMFKAAAKLAPKVSSALDSFARLGRNAGFHLLLTSQELGTDIPTATLNNITVRSALGCQPKVSEMILGNEEAKTNLGKKGYLIYNLSSQNKDPAENSLVRVPFISDEMQCIYKNVTDLSKEVGFQNYMNFYDDQAFRREDEYEEWLRELPRDPNTIYLGEPSYVMKGEIKAVTMQLTGRDAENICILSPNLEHQLRMTKMIKLNAMMHENISNLVLCLNDIFNERINVSELNPAHFYTKRTYENNPMINITKSLLFRRRLCLEADERVFGNQPYSDVLENAFYTIVEKGSDMDTMLNRKRFYNICGLLQVDPQYAAAFALTSMSENDAAEQRVQISKRCLDLYEMYNASTTKLRLSDVPPIFAWIIGIDRLIGIGRDPNSRLFNDFKKLMQDAYLANIRFILVTGSMEELVQVHSAIRWYLLDDLPNNEISKIKCADFYPEQKGRGLAVFYDTMDKIQPCKKFKKMIMNGELAPL